MYQQRKTRRSTENTQRSHTAKKRFGQNFLIDPMILHALAQVIQPNSHDHLVEIGPGHGALTRGLLAQNPARFDAIELDRDLLPGLTHSFGHFPQFTLHAADALTFAYDRLSYHAQAHTTDSHTPDTDARKNTTPLRIVGNLPYNISTPLLFYLLTYKALIKDMHFMLQHEVVERICAQPGSKTYGRLSIFLQYHCQVETMLDVPAQAFDPVPAVESAFVRLIPHATVPYPADDEALFKQLVSLAFTQRRKTIRNALHSHASNQQLEAAEIAGQVRPEQLSVQQFVTLANVLSQETSLRSL